MTIDRNQSDILQFAKELFIENNTNAFPFTYKDINFIKVIEELQLTPRELSILYIRDNFAVAYNIINWNMQVLHNELSETEKQLISNVIYHMNELELDLNLILIDDLKDKINTIIEKI
uniref:Uncharacterized protein n=1 Tax=viral metagenome TaxID=1070528 RepID=A0A6C0JVW1_9ZZZZ